MPDSKGNIDYSVIQCTEIHATYRKKDGAFASPKKYSFVTDDVTVTVTQIITRKISMVSKQPVKVENLLAIHQNIEKLLMLFDGQFYPIETVQFVGEGFDSLSVETDFRNRRLHFYQSDDFCQESCQLISDYNAVFNKTVYDKWVSILSEADIMHQIFLYANASGGFTKDVRLAFLIETAESMIELVKENTKLFSSLKPGNGTSLKECIKGIIDEFGQDIFAREIQADNNGYATFLVKSKDSRVRIMHIKKNFQKDYFNPTEIILYLIKFSLLYRRVILELLNIPYDSYKDNLCCVTKKWENWYDNLKEK